MRSDQVRQRLLFTLIEPGSADGWFESPLSDFPVFRFDGAVPVLPLVAASPDDLVDPFPVGGR